MNVKGPYGIAIKKYFLRFLLQARASSMSYFYLLHIGSNRNKILSRYKNI